MVHDECADRYAWRQRARDAEAELERLRALSLERERVLAKGVAIVEGLKRDRDELWAELEGLKAERDRLVEEEAIRAEELADCLAALERIAIALGCEHDETPAGRARLVDRVEGLDDD